MRPLALAERGICVPTVSLGNVFSGALPGIQGSAAVKLADYVREIVCSGLPGIRPLSERGRTAQLAGYLTRVGACRPPRLPRPPTASMPSAGTLLGALFESLVTLSVQLYAQAAGAETRCRLDTAAPGRGPLLVILDSATTPFRTAMPEAVYRRVGKYGGEYEAGRDRVIG